MPDSAWMRAASCEARANKDILAPPGLLAGFESRALLMAESRDWRGGRADEPCEEEFDCIAERDRPEEKRPAVVLGSLRVGVDCVRERRLLLLLNKLNVCMFASRIVVPR